MKPFFWSHGHVGWPLFAAIVYSVLCLLASDIIWRVVSISSRKLLSMMIVVWAAGVAVLVVLFG